MPAPEPGGTESFFRLSETLIPGKVIHNFNVSGICMPKEIRELFEYNAWANQRMFDAVSGLSPEELNRDLKSSFPSVRETLVHLISAEWIWLSRWKGVSPSKAPENWDVSSFESLQYIWNEVNRDLTKFVSNLAETDLNKEIAYQNIKGDRFSDPLLRMMRHVVNHSTYHRGQITTMLRQLGKESIPTDLIVFFREKTVQQTRHIPQRQ